MFKFNIIWRRLRTFICNLEHIGNFEHLVLLFEIVELSAQN